jgi:hypothetical protein
MIALQEELDWEVYRLYGLITDEEAAGLRMPEDAVPEIALGERAFEIVLARQAAAGEADTEWFKRHRSTPIVEIPAHWPVAYREVVQRRIDLIGRRRDIALIERPECKRRWSIDPWEKREREALKSWLLDRCEDRDLWYESGEEFDTPVPQTINQLADRLAGNADFVSVARLYAGRDVSLAAVLAEILETEHVPYLPQLRYKDSGLRKRAQWERVWAMQRQEDETGERLEIPIPPKYAQADFLKQPYWRNRGKLDVAKERFISYPFANPDGDPALLLGWAGWDHADQATALAQLIAVREKRDNWGRDRILPLVAGLSEVMPWVRQWHSEPDETGHIAALELSQALDKVQSRYDITIDEQRSWRAPKATRKKAAAPKKTTEPTPDEAP